MIADLILYLIGFLLFVFIQGIIINGIHECLQGSAIKDELKGKIFYQGMVIYMLAPKFFERVKNETWFKPFGGCIKCMSSVYGALTYFPFVIGIFGFHLCEIPIFIADIFCLVVINWQIYKRI
mgnify:CR=1 FL=1